MKDIVVTRLEQHYGAMKSKFQSRRRIAENSPHEGEAGRQYSRAVSRAIRARKFFSTKKVGRSNGFSPGFSPLQNNAQASTRTPSQNFNINYKQKRRERFEELSFLVLRLRNGLSLATLPQPTCQH